MRGKEAKLSYMSHVLMEKRNGLVVDGLARRASGSAECLAGEVMLIRRDGADEAVTVGACRKGFAITRAGTCSDTTEPSDQAGSTCQRPQPANRPSRPDLSNYFSSLLVSRF